MKKLFALVMAVWLSRLSSCPQLRLGVAPIITDTLFSHLWRVQ